MVRRTSKLPHADESTSSRPRYELRVKSDQHGDVEIMVWQLPSHATPRLEEPEKTATLKGRPLRLIESRILRRLKHQGASIGRLRPGEELTKPLDEEEAVSLALMFRSLAPMRSLDRIQLVADGIDRLSPEEASYWLGMAIHRSRPRRVLAALRTLLTIP